MEFIVSFWGVGCWVLGVVWVWVGALAVWVGRHALTVMQAIRFQPQQQ